MNATLQILRWGQDLPHFTLTLNDRITESRNAPKARKQDMLRKRTPLYRLAHIHKKPLEQPIRG
jgi:hypothetical protein